MVKALSGIWVTLVGILILFFGRGDTSIGIAAIIATGAPTLAVGVWLMLGVNLGAKKSKTQNELRGITSEDPE